MAGKSKVYLCRGKHCGRSAAEVDALAALLDGVARVERVDCQKICKPPVVGTVVGGELQWFARVDTEKSRRRLLQLLHGKRLRKALAKRRVERRRGKLR